ncbi:hypothetical protein PoB_001419100 [Plakobranchus ocellatus]|uniref:Secreted protein n=1 Tax=Plakobranchus ocellatus TaxID=259542 RepID=A0AAV3YZC7_9GAST|nr:hypothetical protein PoB_001419100 [Plakobranchus ocellatus]
MMMFSSVFHAVAAAASTAADDDDNDDDDDDDVIKTRILKLVQELLHLGLVLEWIAKLPRDLKGTFCNRLEPCHRCPSLKAGLKA